MEMMWEIFLICLTMLGIVIVVYIIIGLLLHIFDHFFTRIALLNISKQMSEMTDEEWEEHDKYYKMCKEECKHCKNCEENDEKNDI